MTDTSTNPTAQGADREPDYRVLHLGAGRQSTAICLLIANGVLPKPDLVLFSDTHREPKQVYRHLQRVEAQLLAPAGVPLKLVSHGDLFADVLDPHRFATIPAYTLELIPQERGWVKWHERKEGRQPRHCTGRYKIEPLQQEERLLLGAAEKRSPCKYCEATGTRMAPWNAKLLRDLGIDGEEAAELAKAQAWAGPGPCSVCNGTGTRREVGKAPRGRFVEVWVGYDANEAAARINDALFATYQRPRYPLLELARPPERIADDQRRLRRHREVGWTLADCLWYLHQNGWKDVPKSACIPCPNASNARWRDMRDNDPESWQEAVRMDRELRTAPGMRSERFLHEDRVPLDQANIDRPSAAERRAAQGDLFDQLADIDWGGCSPHGCQTDLPEVA